MHKIFDPLYLVFENLPHLILFSRLTYFSFIFVNEFVYCALVYVIGRYKNLLLMKELVMLHKVLFYCHILHCILPNMCNMYLFIHDYRIVLPLGCGLNGGVSEARMCTSCQ